MRSQHEAASADQHPVSRSDDRHYDVDYRRTPFVGPRSVAAVLLTISTMDREEFADNVDSDGIFRGFE
jgi:hypothetical protein